MNGEILHAKSIHSFSEIEKQIFTIFYDFFSTFLYSERAKQVTAEDLTVGAGASTDYYIIQWLPAY